MGVIFFAAALGSVTAWYARSRRGDGSTKRRPDSRSNAPEQSVPAAPASRRPGADGAVSVPDYRLTYADPYGEIADRVIRSPWSGFSNGVAYLDAWCSRRNERRTFRASRIVQLLQADGKRIGDPVGHFAMKVERRGRRRRPPTDGHERAMEGLKPSLGALLWIARSDSDIDASVIALLREYVDLHLAADGNRFEVDPHRLGIWIDDAAPTITTARLGVIRMEPDERGERLFRECADKIVRSGGTVDERKASKLRRLFAA